MQDSTYTLTRTAGTSPADRYALANSGQLSIYSTGSGRVPTVLFPGAYGMMDVQFSRGCPHRCTYCGQHGFWVRWRHRDPAPFADEVEWLHRRHGIRFITLADENPTTLRSEWQHFLEELARRRLPVYFFATIRATDIVRDADLLPLYRVQKV